MTSFENTTLLKGLERLLPGISSESRRDQIYGALGKYMLQCDRNLKISEDKLYSGIEDAIAKAEEGIFSKKEINFGKLIEDSLRSSKSYDIVGIRPDPRKLRRYRRKETEVIKQILNREEV